MSQPSARSTTEEIVASISIGVGVANFNTWYFCSKCLPELHKRFSPGLLVTIEMLIGRIDQISDTFYPNYSAHVDSTGDRLLLEPENSEWRILISMQSVHNRIGNYFSIGFREFPELEMWFKLGSAIGRHIDTLNEKDRTNLELEYRKIFERHADPSIYLEDVFKDLEKHTFLKEKWTQTLTQIREFARTLESKNPGRATEQRIVTTARQEFQNLSEKDILVIRSILSLVETGEKKITNKKILKELLQTKYKGRPGSWKFEGDEPSSQFKNHLSHMVKTQIIYARPYCLAEWSGLCQ